MLLALTACVITSLVLSLIATGFARKIGERLSALDGQGVAGQVKAEVRRIPNTGGIGIALTLIIMLAGVGLAAQCCCGRLGLSEFRQCALGKALAGQRDAGGNTHTCGCDLAEEAATSGIEILLRHGKVLLQWKQIR